MVSFQPRSNHFSLLSPTAIVADTWLHGGGLLATPGFDVALGLRRIQIVQNSSDLLAWAISLGQQLENLNNFSLTTRESPDRVFLVS